MLGIDAITAELIHAFMKYRREKREEELQTPEWKALEESYTEHLRWRFKYPSKVFGQQLTATWIITFLVLALVLSGLIFSFVQLHASIKVGDLTSLKTDLAVETAGKLSVSSSVIGAIVLVISLAFFYLYLKHVFQIQHPVPPHVSLYDTDASKIYAGLKEEPPDDFLRELQGLRTRFGYHGPVVSFHPEDYLWRKKGEKYPKHGKKTQKERPKK